MTNIKMLVCKTKAKLALMSTLLFAFLSVDVFANVETGEKLTFDASVFEFVYITRVTPALIVIDNKKQNDITALTENFWKLPTAKSYFELSYAYIQNYGRKYIESIKVDISDSQVKIFTSAPLRKITITDQSMPLHLFVSEKIAINAKTEETKVGFQFVLPIRLLNNFCKSEQTCKFSFTDVRGKRHSYDYKHVTEPTELPIKGIGFYGSPCTPACVEFNSQSLKALSEQLSIKVIDVANQQRTFNETILCESGVLIQCKNGLVSSSTKNSLEWHVMENQLVVQQREIIKHQRFFQSEVLIAWINPMMNETHKVTSVFARHKNKKTLIELLSKKTAVIAQIIIAKASY